MTLYQKAKQLLQSEYEKNFEIVKDSFYHTSFMNEKIRHSLQVAGAGNGILRNETYFKSKSSEFIEIAKTAILLHDIFRFNEIRIKYQDNKKVDHGVEGAKYLSELTDFNNLLITLPVKHHGHMIDVFYEDEAYFSIKDEELKDQIKHILFAARDADKIANWQILTKEYENMRLVWLPHPEDRTEKQGQITNKVWNSFLEGEVVLNSYIQTNADCLVSVLAWVFDINYRYSIDYSMRLNHLDGFEKILQDLKVEQSKIDTILNIVKDYISKRFY